jgi:hypothetical protein
MICIILTSSLLYEINLTSFSIADSAAIVPPELKFRSKRQQRNVLCALNGYGQPALVPRACSGHAARKNLPALLDERRQNFGLLVVNEVRLVHAEPANFLFANEAALAALCRTTARSAGASARTTWSAATRP